MKRLAPLTLAVSLLTTLPVGRWLPQHIEPVDQGRSVVCYPLVGLLIGALLVFVHALCGGAAPLLAATLLLTAWVAATGALHLDGLADCADAWFAGHGDASRTLTVMKDPAAGPVAVVAIGLTLLLKFAALAALVDHDASIVGLLLTVPMLARAAAAALIAATAYRREQGIARDHAATRPRAAIAAAVLAALVVGALGVSPARWALLVLVGAVVAWGWRRLWQRRIGGYTGDVAGALIELVETAGLVAAAWSLAWA